jgi:hypothetical protein
MVLVLVVRLTLLIFDGVVMEDVLDLCPNLNLGILSLNGTLGAPTLRAKSLRVPGIWLSDCMGKPSAR